MQVILSHPIPLAVLLLLAAQSVLYLVDGFGKRRRQRLGKLSEQTRLLTRQELVVWGVIPPEQDIKSPAVRSLMRGWLGITAWNLIGMGVGMLLAAAAVLVVLALFNANASLSPQTPPDILAAALLLGGYACGMCGGALLGVFIGATRGSAAAPPAAPEQPAPHLAEYRARQVAALPGALLLIDALLIGGLHWLFLQPFSRAELWSLAVFPGLLALIVAGAEVFTRRLARVSLRLADDAALAERAANRSRARVVGMLLEREIFALFVLVVCQWLIQTFTPGHSASLVYNGALPVYAVILLSMRSLLERAQQATAR